MIESTNRKRSASESGFPKPMPKKGHWSQGLRSAAKDPSLHIEKDDSLVIIKDKYPKAKHHFLILPHEDIPNLKALKPKHQELLEHMEAKAKTLAEKFPDSEFRFGYHAIPSMSLLHLHMISQDFDSPFLKTKKHWNSFNTRFFLESSEVIRVLKEDGSACRIALEAGKDLLDQPLKCHKCSFSPPNMPKLKQHLLKHCQTA